MSTSIVFLTGVAGFIGSHTARRLLEEGHTVIGIDNLNNYYNPEWKKQNLEPLIQHKHFVFYELDILDWAGLGEIATRHHPTSIIHLAARAGVRPSIADPLLYQQVNVQGTNNILELARQHEIAKVIYASSSSVYGNDTPTPFKETARCDQPISPYAATKRAGELLAHTYSHLFGIQTIGLRFFTVYGPAGRPDMAPYLFTEAILRGQPIKQFGDGSSARDYTYIDDIVEGIVACLKLEGCKPEIFNLGHNQPIKLRNFIKTLELITGRKAQITLLKARPGDVQQTWADITKAQQVLYYQPQFSLELGLEKFVDWYTKYRL